MLKLLRSVSCLLTLTVLFSTTVDSAVYAQSEPPTATASVLADLSQEVMARRSLACTGCHGKQGVATASGYFPRIAGKPAGYLLNQLRHFQSGQRQFEGMNRLIKDLPDAYLAQFASYFESLQLPYPKPVARQLAPAAARRADELVTRGDSALGVPACASCHGRTLTGVYPSTPGLLGLPRDYIIAQFGAWQNDLRQASPPDCMAEIAHRLKPGDVVALADWLSSRNLPADTRPSDEAERAPTLECGSLKPPKRPTSSAGVAPRAMDPGRYLALIGNCAGCHSQTGNGLLAGGVPILTPFGRVFASNITPDKKSGIGRWSKAEFHQAMTQGTNRHGEPLNPVFPYQFFNQMNRSDIDNLYDWIQSAPASSKANHPHELRFPYDSALALRIWRWLFVDLEPRETVTVPALTAPSIERGRYLVESVMHCNTCHGKRNFLGAFSQSDRMGGQRLPGFAGYAPSLSSPTETPLAQWSVQSISRFLKTGHTPEADANGLMALIVQESTQHLTDADALSAGLYLKSLVQPVEATSQRRHLSGSVPALWDRHCSECHGKNGQGKPDQGPPLAGRRSVTLANSDNVLATILYGGFGPATPSRPAPPGMPGYAYQLNDQEIALLANFLRNAWGNSARRISAAQVQQAR